MTPSEEMRDAATVILNAAEDGDAKGASPTRPEMSKAIVDLLAHTATQFDDEMRAEGAECTIQCVYFDCDHKKDWWHVGAKAVDPGCGRHVGAPVDGKTCTCFDKLLALARAINRSATDDVAKES